MSIAGSADALLLDLDGVVYTGAVAVPGAVDALRRARGDGLSLRFVTNNASRTPEQVAERLVGVGVQADPGEVLTSAQAAARLLADRDDVTSGATVAVVGGPGLVQAVLDQGLVPVAVRDVTERPDAVVQGFSAELGWADLAAATRWVRAGVPWVASNLDETIPVETGIAPGNGLLVHVVAVAAGRRPDGVAGKPEPVLFGLAAESCGSAAPVVVGDRLDTDIAGGNAAGQRTVLVLTGVHGVLEALAAAPSHRPDLLVADLGRLWDDTSEVTQDGDGWAGCGDAAARVQAGVQLRGAPGVALARALLAATWSAVDGAGPHGGSAGHGGEPDGAGARVLAAVLADESVVALDAALRPAGHA